jgi:hypothetical protein
MTILLVFYVEIIFVSQYLFLALTTSNVFTKSEKIKIKNI